jgi:hypothetical protein
LLVGVSQNLGQAATSASDAGKCATADAQRSTTSWESAQPADNKDRARVGCSPVAPTPPPPPSWQNGTATIAGRLFDGDGNGLMGWVINLSGTLTSGAAVSASTTTDATGSFAFRSLPYGTYTVCEAMQSGWGQYWPFMGTQCPSTSDTRLLGYTYTISDGGGYLGYFGNMML